MSFRRDEVDAMCQLFEIIARGGSPSIIVRQNGVLTTYGKFKRMQDKLLRAQSQKGKKR